MIYRATGPDFIMNRNLKISIVICTYNRSRLLRKCLDSLVGQTASLDQVEIIVVDNNSSDDTPAAVNDFAEKIQNLIYVTEIEQGLSNARNTGYKNARAEWVAYLDDDGIAYPDYIEQIYRTIENYDFDCFGGVYDAFFETHPPKWLPKNFGRKDYYPDHVEDITETIQTASGGVIIFKKHVLEELNGFDISWGMNGKQVAYGEETELQQRLRKAGKRIGLNPAIKIKHLVSPRKYSLIWQLKSIYARQVFLHHDLQQRKSSLTIIRDILYIIRTHIPTAVYKWLTKKEYYWQNMFLDMSLFFILLYLKLLALLKRLFHCGIRP